jgi:hypothetical protein
MGCKATFVNSIATYRLRRATASLYAVSWPWNERSALLSRIPLFAGCVSSAGCHLVLAQITSGAGDCGVQNGQKKILE